MSEAPHQVGAPKDGARETYLNLTAESGRHCLAGNQDNESGGPHVPRKTTGGYIATVARGAMARTSQPFSTGMERAAHRAE